jgi:hypothetical protein
VSDRKREVVAEFSTYYVCDVHGWDYTNVDEDVCPVCLGESSERERIVAILKEELRDSMDSIQGTKGGWREHLIALIKGETNE